MAAYPIKITAEREVPAGAAKAAVVTGRKVITLLLYAATRAQRWEIYQ